MNRFIAAAILGTLLLAVVKPGVAQTQEAAAAQTSGTLDDSTAIERSASEGQSAAELGKSHNHRSGPDAIVGVSPLA
jgi:uncharacterized low-complexity protein